jgi:hypothetical protein
MQCARPCRSAWVDFAIFPIDVPAFAHGNVHAYCDAGRVGTFLARPEPEPFASSGVRRAEGGVLQALFCAFCSALRNATTMNFAASARPLVQILDPSLSAGAARARVCAWAVATRFLQAQATLRALCKTRSVHAFAESTCSRRHANGEERCTACKLLALNQPYR